MEKLKALFVTAGNNIKQHRVFTTALVLGSSAPAFAADTDFDVTGPLGYIAAGVVAKMAVGPAWAGLKYVGKAWNKV
jgi:hypothetical protein